MPEIKKEATAGAAQAEEEEEVVEESGVAATVSLTPQPTPPPLSVRPSEPAPLPPQPQAQPQAQVSEVVLAFGRLVCDVAVAPPLAVPAGVLAPAFPRVLAVAGFVPAALLPSPPSVAVHSVVPVLLRGAGAERDRTQRAFFALLQHTLVSEHQHALVALDADWFAVLTAPYVLPFSGTERPSSPLQLLLLHVLAPAAELPGIGRLTVDSLALCTPPPFAVI